MTIYLDASYLVRLYLDEPGSVEVRHLCDRGRICSALHAQAELPAALHRAFREGRLRQDVFSAALAQIAVDHDDNRFQWLPFPPDLLKGMVTHSANLPRQIFLRAADALHLACAAAHGFGEVYSNDRHFLAAAPFFGLKGMNVIP